jgi:hypothetical protein
VPGFASGRQQDRVPWKQIKEYTADFIDDRYLPDSVDGAAVIEDPSDMKKEQITRLLDHWRRPVPGSDLFRFSHVLVNTKTDSTTPALYEDSLSGVIAHAPAPIEGGASNWDEEYASGLQSTPPVADMHLDESVLTSMMPDFEPELPALLPEAQDVNVLPRGQTPIIDPRLIGLRWPPQVPEGSLLPAPSALKPSGTKLAEKQSTSKKSTSKKEKQAAVPQPNNSALPVEVAPPKDRPRPKPKVVQAPVVATSVGNPAAQNLIDGAGLPTKRVPKRKLDIYVAAEERAEEQRREKEQAQAAAKRQRKK